MSSTGVLDVVTALDGADIAAADSVGCTELLGQVRRTRGWLDALEARLTSRLTELHDTAGGAPAADQHSRCGGVSSAEGKRKERRAATIDEAPSFGTALADGAIGAEHVDALANATSTLDDDVKQRLLGLEPDLLVDATSMSPEKFGRSCRELARRLERDAGVERNRRQRRETFLSRKLNAATGMIEGRFAFHPELADRVFGPVDREVAAMVAERERAGDPEFVGRRFDRNRLAAEALGRLVGAGHGDRRPGVAEITYIVDARTVTTGEMHDGSLCETGSGLPVPPTSVQRAMCEGAIVPVIIDEHGVVLNAGRTLRHANRVQRRALRAMYRTCALGDCDVPFYRCEIHHIVPWELGGTTDLANLLPICSRHHHLVHERGWTLELGDDRTLVIVQPNGTEFARTRPDIAEHTTGRRRTRRRTAA